MCNSIREHPFKTSGWDFPFRLFAIRSAACGDIFVRSHWVLANVQVVNYLLSGRLRPSKGRQHSGIASHELFGLSLDYHQIRRTENIFRDTRVFEKLLANELVTGVLSFFSTTRVFNSTIYKQPRVDRWKIVS